MTLARQGSDRANKIVSNQTGLVDRFATGSLQHAASLGVEYTFEEQVAPTLTGLGTRAPVDIYSPNPSNRSPAMLLRPAARSAKGRRIRLRSTRSTRSNLTSRWQASGGFRWEYYDTTFQAVDAAGLTTTDLSASDGLLSGKVGPLYRVNAAGNIYVSYGTAITPPGTANFTLSAQPNNQNNPSVEPQKSTNYEVGSKWDFADGRVSLNTARVPHGERERHLHRGRDGHSAPLQPGRCTARQRCDGRRHGPRDGSLADPREYRLPRFGAADTELGQQRPAV